MALEFISPALQAAVKAHELQQLWARHPKNGDPNLMLPISNHSLTTDEKLVKAINVQLAKHKLTLVHDCDSNLDPHSGSYYLTKLAA